MKAYAILRRRLDRLEVQRKQRRVPRTVAHIFGNDPETIIGFLGDAGGARIHVWRAGGEAVSACLARAWREIASSSLFALYPAPAVALPPVAPLAPVAAPVAAPKSLAGIGRTATREELIRMGAIAIPPERLV